MSRCPVSGQNVGVVIWLSDRELLDLGRRLAFKHARERGEIDLCGVLFDVRTSCQLVTGHAGAHAWQSHDARLLVRW